MNRGAALVLAVVVMLTSLTVDWHADRTTQAITQVNGPISRILVDTGAQVKAGGSGTNKEFV
jgi:hypothetical protein